MSSNNRLIVIASCGGHLIQLLRLRPLFEKFSVTYVTTGKGNEELVPDSRCFIVKDASRWDKVGLVIMLLQIFIIIIRVRPDVIITTGAAPGLFAIRIGKLFGAKTIWLDSLANVEQISMSGKLVGPYADLWLTQWPELEREGGPIYKGRVL